MKKYLITILAAATLLGSGKMVSATTNKNVANQKAIEEANATEEVNTENLMYGEQGQQQLKDIKELKTKLENYKELGISNTEYVAMVDELMAKMPVLIEKNKTKIGDDVDQSLLGLELEEANDQLEVFKEFLNTVDANVSQYKPFTPEEMLVLMGE